MAVKKSDLYASLWQSCDELRGGMDASQYKDYVLVLLFMKYVSDRASDPASVLDVPPEASFDALVALKGDKEIGDKINKVIGALAKANDLHGVIDVADFNDDSKLGKGQEMVDRLSKLVGIFQNPALDFSGNQAEGDDLLGDAYEYLMRNFATESGKSKGQFYTPAEVSRVMASVIGLNEATRASQSIHDPTCGSGSLLLKAHDVAKSATGLDLTIYGQEMDNATAALARMNMWLHGAGLATIENDNTLARPRFKEADDELKRFDFVVANPPFSTKAWSNGLKPTKDVFGRFEYGVPPAKNGDYAFLLHILACTKPTGSAAVILPHGVLFRGNAEAAIRREIVQRGFIKGIIGLPGNLFYGTGIPACILVLDKEGAADRDSIFMVDASKGYAKDGAKNRLRERDIHRIVDVFTTETEVPGYSRKVAVAEVASSANDFNLSLPRYLDTSALEDRQDLRAHLAGGIPRYDVDLLEEYWTALPLLRDELFQSTEHPNYVRLRQAAEDVSGVIRESSEFQSLQREAKDRFDVWATKARDVLSGLPVAGPAKEAMTSLAESLLDEFRSVSLIDEYAVYQRFTEYWSETMSDDAHLVAAEGWAAAAAPAKVPPKSKGRIDFTAGTDQFRSALLPAALLIARYLPQEQEVAVAAAAELQAMEDSLEEMLLEHGQEGGLLEDAVGDKGKFTKGAIETRVADLRGYHAGNAFPEEAGVVTELKNELAAADQRLRDLQAELGGESGVLSHVTKAKGLLTKTLVKERRRDLGDDSGPEGKALTEAFDAFEAVRKAKASYKAAQASLDASLDAAGEPADEFSDERSALAELTELLASEAEARTRLADAQASLNAGVVEAYAGLTEPDIASIAIEDKWLVAVADAVQQEVEQASRTLQGRIRVLHDRYRTPLPAVEEDVRLLSARVSAHLDKVLQ